MSVGSPKTKHHKERPAFKTQAARLARRIRAERAARGWTLEHAAEKFGVEPAHVRRLEAATANPTLSVMVSIARALSTSCAGLMSLEPKAIADPVRMERVRLAAMPHLRRLPEGWPPDVGFSVTALEQGSADEFWTTMAERGAAIVAALLDVPDGSLPPGHALSAAMAVALALAVVNEQAPDKGTPRSRRHLPRR